MSVASRHVSRNAWLWPALALLFACSDGGEPAPPVVSTVTVSPGLFEVAPGQTASLTATAIDAAGVPISGRTTTWISSNPSVLTVSAAGVVTGVADGIASVTATIDGKSGSAAAVVRTPVASVVVTPSAAGMTLGGTPVQLTATPSSGTGVALPGRTVTWSSSAPAIATVSGAGLVTAVSAGTATISATSENVVGSATITVSPNPCTVIRALPVGQTFNGSLMASDCKLSDSTAFQRFEFTLTAPQKLEIVMSSNAVDSYLLLADASLNVIDEDDDGGTGINARILRTLAAGRYFVLANTYDPLTFGAYSVAVRAAPAACVSGRATTIPSTNDALLSAASCLARDEALEDRYEITVTSRTTLTMSMTSSAFDPLLIVTDDQERVIVKDDDSGAGLNALIEVELQPGRYTILARGLPGQFGGAYRLVVSTLVDPCAVTRTIGVGQTASGTFSAADCAIRESSSGVNRYFHRYLLTLPASTTVQIAMNSSIVDAYLVLQHAVTGAIWVENDDASELTTNSLIIAPLPPGQYIINATTYEAGEVGPYQLSVSAVQASGISVAVTPQNLTLQAGQTQQATATVTGTTNTAVTWQSTAPGIASVTATGVIRGITPGQAVIVAISVADPARTASLSVTVSASTTITNLDVPAAYLVQVVQQLDGRVPLVSGRDAVARVFVRGNRPGLGVATARVRIFQGATLLGTFTGSASPSVTVDESCCSANITIPGSAVRVGISILADVDPDNAVGESNEADNQYPLSGAAQSLTVVDVAPFTIRFVPVLQNRNAQTSAFNQSLFNVFRSMWPLNAINFAVRTPLVIDYNIGTQTFDDWSRLVRDVEVVRQVEGGAAYYYGLVRTRGTSGVLGLANGIPARTAIGVDEGSDFGAAEARLTFAHEMGHTLSLRHAPCGGAAGPEPSYPFADGRTGVYGMDMFNGNVIKLPTAKDVMTYCDNQWVSAFNYRKVLDFRQANPNGAGLKASPTDVLMVSGSIARGTLAVDPAFSVRASPASDDPGGRYVVEGFDADNRRLFVRRFSPYRVEDAGEDAEAFVIAVPVSAAVQAQLVRLDVRSVGADASGRAASRRVPTARTIGTGVTTTRGGAGLQASWSPTQLPVVMVRDRGTGEVLALFRNGTADLAQFGASDRVELLLSDGVKSTRAIIDPTSGAIRR